MNFSKICFLISLAWMTYCMVITEDRIVIACMDFLEFSELHQVIGRFFG